MPPIAAQVAGLEPHMAAKMAQPATFATPSPPGRRYSQRCVDSYRSTAARVLPMAAPIRTNNGIASRVKLLSSP